MVRFRAPRGTLLWIKDPDHLGMEKEGEFLLVRDENTSIGSILFSIPFFLVGFGVITASFIYAAYDAYSHLTDDSVCDTRYSMEFELGGGEIYCEGNEWNALTSIATVEIADEHFRYILSWEEGSSEQQEFRWVEVDGLLTIGLFQEYDGEGYYQCELYKRNSSLPQNWTGDDLVVRGYWSSMPDWCHGGDASTDNISYLSAEGPLFDGERLYQVTDENFGDIGYQIYTTKSLEYNSLYLPYEPFFLEFLFPVLFGLVFGGIFLTVGDSRGIVLKLNASNRTMSIRKTFGGTRLSGWTWKEVDFSTLQMKQYQKSVEHSSGGGEDGPVHTWTTYHKGIEVAITAGGRTVDLLFLEHGENFNIYDISLKNFCDSLGVEMPEIEKKLRQKVSVKTSPEEVQLSDFPVAEWDSENDARHLLNWYDNHTSRPDSLTLGEALDLSGIEDFTSEQDAQRLLDYFIGILDDEMGDATGEESPPEGDNEADESAGSQDGDKQGGYSKAFWNDA